MWGLYFPPQTFNCLFCIGVELMNNVVVASGEQWRDSDICIHVSILPWTLLPSMLPRNTEQSSMCSIIGPCWLSILFIFNFEASVYFSSVSYIQFSSVQLLSHVDSCNPMDSSTPGFPVHHQLPELAQTHVHQGGDAIQPSHPLLPPSLPTFNLSRHQGL